MASFTSPNLSATKPFAYTMITPQYAPDTTVAIFLRQFEKDSKTQAETEYDAEHGPLPELPEDDDHNLSVDKKERNIQKKKRKVRSAIVSRRKSAIYEKKLEEELRVRDNINTELKTRLSVYHDVLRDVRAKIHALQRHFDSSSVPVPKRIRTTQHQHQHHQHQHQHQHQTSIHPTANNNQNSNFLFPYDNPIDDLLYISAEENRMQQHQNNVNVNNVPFSKSVSYARDTDFTSECSDRQISPMLHSQSRDPQRDVPMFPADDTSWRFSTNNIPSNIAPQQLIPNSFPM